MNHFKKLIIENFQSHQYTEIDFSQGLNVFVGPSDSGKSAILRALRWVLFNVPRGNDFIRTGANQCRVSLLFTDETEVIRIRSSSINRYILRIPGKDEQIFEGWGTGVPEEIKAAHRIHPIKLDQKEIFVHFGPQLESPFLLFESDRNKAKTIGRISGAQLIDHALKKASSDRQSISTQMRQLEEQREQIMEKLKPYENLPQLEETYLQAQAAFQQARLKQTKKERLQKLLSDLQAVRTEKGTAEQTIQQLQHLPTVQQMMWKLEKSLVNYRHLKRLLEKKRQITIELEICEQRIQESSQLPVLEQLLVSLGHKQQRLIQLDRLKGKWQQHKQQHDRALKVLQLLAEIPTAIKMVEQIHVQAGRLKSLTQLKSQWQSNQKEKQQVGQMLSHSPHLSELMKQGLPDLDEKINRLSRLKILHEKWTNVHWRVEKGTKFCQEKEKEIVSLTNNWAQLLKKMGKCPTCGSQIHASIIEQMLEEYQGGFSRAAAGREDQTD